MEPPHEKQFHFVTRQRHPDSEDIGLLATARSFLLSDDGNPDISSAFFDCFVRLLTNPDNGVLGQQQRRHPLLAALSAALLRCAEWTLRLINAARVKIAHCKLEIGDRRSKRRVKERERQAVLTDLQPFIGRIKLRRFMHRGPEDLVVFKDGGGGAAPYSTAVGVGSPAGDSWGGVVQERSVAGGERQEEGRGGRAGGEGRGRGRRSKGGCPML